MDGDVAYRQTDRVSMRDISAQLFNQTARGLDGLDDEEGCVAIVVGDVGVAGMVLHERPEERNVVV